MSFLIFLFTNGAYLLLVNHIAKEILILEPLQVWRDTCKKKRYKLVIGVFSISLLELLFAYEVPRIIYSSIFILGILKFCFKKTQICLLYYVMVIQLLLVLLDAISLNFTECLPISSYFPDSMTNLYSLVYAIILVITFCLLTIAKRAIVTKYNRSTRQLDVVQLRLIILFLLIGIILEFLLWAIWNLDELQKARATMLVFNLVITLFIYFQTHMLFPTLFSQNLYREKAEIMEHHLDEQKQYYIYLEQREQETRKLRHDMRAHLSMVSYLYSKNENAKVGNYLMEMTDNLNNVGKSVELNNGIVEAIVNRYRNEAESIGANMRVKGSFPTEMNISDYDLVTIFSNLLSNAVEATGECGGKQISLEIRHEHNKIFTHIENTCHPDLQIHSERIVSTKSDRQIHGFGLQNAIDAAKRNEGWIRMEVKDGQFHTYLQLSNERKEQVTGK